MYRSGAFVAGYVSPTTDAQVQPNGVDLTLAAVHEQREPGRIGRDGTEVGDRQPRHPDPTSADVGGPGGDHPGVAATGGDGASVGGDDPTAGVGSDGSAGGDDGDTYYLPPGGYVVQYGETVAVPEDHVGFVYPRSSLLRNSCMLNTAVWDAGYEGRGEGLLQVHHDIEIERGARLAQFVLASAEHEDTYDGNYQHENV